VEARRSDKGVGGGLERKGGKGGEREEWEGASDI